MPTRAKSPSRGPSRARDYLVTTFEGGQGRRVLWQGRSDLTVGHFSRWRLERGPRGIQALPLGSTRKRGPVPIPDEVITRGTPVKLMPAEGEGGGILELSIRALKPLPPPYAPESYDAHANVESHRHFLYCGLKDHLVTFSRVGDRFKIHVDGRLIFTHKRKHDGHHITPREEGMTFEGRDSKSRSLPTHRPTVFSDEAWVTGTLRWGHHWWRATSIPVPEDVTFHGTRIGIASESRLFGEIAKWVLGSLAVLTAAVLLAPRNAPSPRREPLSTEVSLKPSRRMLKVPEEDVPIEPDRPPAAVEKIPRKTDAPRVKARPVRKEPVAAPPPPRSSASTEAPPPPRQSLMPQLPPPLPAELPRIPPAESRLTIGGSGKVEKPEIERLLETRLMDFQACYRKALARNPRARGIVEASWVIEGDGRVFSVDINRSDIDDPEMIGCLSSEIARINFPRPRGGTVRVTYPMLFATGF